MKPNVMYVDHLNRVARFLAREQIAVEFRTSAVTIAAELLYKHVSLLKSESFFRS